MKKENFEEYTIDYLRGDLNGEEKREFEIFLEQNKDFQVEFEEVKATWQIFNQVGNVEASKQMDESFYKALHIELENNKPSRITELSELFFGWFKPKYAFGAMLLAIGILGGYFLKGGDAQENNEDVMVVTNDSGAREKLVLTLLEQPSANKRLDGVSEANKITHIDVAIINALLKTLNNDPNVNVRLAAIESLSNYVDDAKVRQGLVQSIPNQKAPIVQVTLANLMLALQEKKSVEPFKQLLQKKELDTTVKKKIESTIQSII